MNWPFGIGLSSCWIGDQRRNANKAVSGPLSSKGSRSQSRLDLAHKTGAQIVINGLSPCVETLHGEASAHALTDTNADGVKRSVVPRAVTENRPGAGARLQLPCVARHASDKSQIRSPDPQDIAYVAMLVIRLDHAVTVDLSLHPKMKTTGVRSLEARIDSYWDLEDLRNWEVHAEVAKTSPEEEPRRLANSRAGCVANCCGSRPVKLCTLSWLTTVLRGIEPCPEATTGFR